MNKIILLLSLLVFITSCSSEDIADNEAIDPNSLTDTQAENTAIVAFPYSGSLSEVYYGGQKLPVEVYNNEVYVFEGDIILSKDLATTEEVKLIYEKGETPPANKSVGKTLHRWTNSTVYYSVDPKLQNQDRVFDAIKHWEDRTNLKFVERSYQKNYIFFTPGEGCSSYVGMQGGRQEITLASGCSTGSTIHEIGHALGLWHEQSRMDRDSFITILYENIESGKEHNFLTYGERKMDGAEFTDQLDFQSIMMYGAHDFSKNGKPTIVKKDGSVYGVNRSHLSEGDLQGIFQMYSEDAPDYSPTYRNGNYYVIDGVNVYRMHDRWYFYDEENGWRELKRKEGYWFFAD